MVTLAGRDVLSPTKKAKVMVWLGGLGWQEKPRRDGQVAAVFGL